MNKLKFLRKNKKITQADIAKVLHVDRTVYLRMENGIYQIDNNSLKILADYYGVTTDYLLGLEESEHSSKVKGIKIPIVGHVVAGIPLEAIENIEGYEEISPAMAVRGEFFALRVKGRSMEPYLLENDTVIVKKQNDVENDAIAIILVNGDEATVKKIKKQETGITLIGLNTSVYEPHFYTNEEVLSLPIVIVGRVVEIRRALA
jgi:SOS-response transcriptional repressors (RecA-mediated autopeptidases)